MRKRPAMYIGGVDSARLAPPALGDRRQLGRRGHQRPRRRGSTSRSHKDGTRVTVTDNGRGIPVDIHPKYKKPALELILTHAARGRQVRAGDNYMLLRRPARRRLVRGQRAVAQAGGDDPPRRQASTRRRSRAARPPVEARRSWARRAARHDDLLRPDPEIFGEKLQFDAELIRERLEAKTYLHKGLTIIVRRTKAHRRDVRPHARRRHRRVPAASWSPSAASRPVHRRSRSRSSATSETARRGRAAVDRGDRRGRSAPTSTASPPPAAARTRPASRPASSRPIRNYIETHELIKLRA